MSTSRCRCGTWRTCFSSAALTFAMRLCASGGTGSAQCSREHCQVNSTEAPLSSLCPSCCDGLIPGTKGVAAEFSESLAADQVGLGVEGIVARRVRGEEALGRCLGLELLHLSFG